MSLFARPSVVFAIIFGCFAVLVPRVFLPLFRPKPSTPSHHINDRFRPPTSPMPRIINDDTIEHIPGSPSHPNTRGRHSGAKSQQQITKDPSGSKSAVTFALPMYTVGIAVFFIYTCFKYWAKRNTQDDKIKLRYSTNNIQWNAQKRKFKYDINNHHNENDEENDEDVYTGLDPDYVEYLRLKKQKEIDVEQTMTTEDRQMHHTLDSMKQSLSFISSKLGANQTKKNLTTNEIFQLQDRLASTEAQMCKVLNALDAASSKVKELSKNTRQSLEQPQQEDEHHLSSSENEDSVNDEENSNSDDDSFHQEEQQLSLNNQEEEEESASSYEEEEEEVPNEEDNDSESESSSERYGIMHTNYACDPTTIDDYELNTINKSDEPSDSRTKVQEWHERNHSQSLSSNNSLTEQDHSVPNEE